MSRIGRTPIPLSQGVEINRSEERAVTVSGPRGSLSLDLPPGIDIVQEEKELKVTRDNDSKDLKSKHGLIRSLLSNMVHGTTEGYKRTLEIQGVGYRAEASGQTLKLHIGYSHPVEYQVPDEIAVSVENNTQITLDSYDKQAVGQTASKIRALRPPDAYKGKGIRYVGEEVSLKEGKSVG